MYTTQQAASKLDYHDSHIRWLIKHGKLKATRLGKRLWVISEAELKRASTEKADRKLGKQATLL